MDAPNIPRLEPPGGREDAEPEPEGPRYCVECRMWHEAGDPLCQHEEAAACAAVPDEDQDGEAERRAVRQAAPADDDGLPFGEYPYTWPGHEP